MIFFDSHSDVFWVDVLGAAAEDSASSKGDVTPGFVLVSELEATGSISGVGAEVGERLGVDCLLSLSLPSVTDSPLTLYCEKN